jgi:hypothetical protein
MAQSTIYFVTSILKPQKMIYSKFLRPISYEEYKIAMLNVFELIQKSKLTKWVMVSSVSDFTMESQKWSVEYLGLLFQDTTLQKVAMVRDQDAILQVVAEKMRSKIYSLYGTEKELEHFESLEEALNFLAPESSVESLKGVINQEIG